MMDLDKLWIAAGKKDKEREYWLNKLPGELIESAFPAIYEHERETVDIDAQGHGPDQEGMVSIAFDLGKECTQGLIESSASSDVRLHILLTSICTLLLAKYTAHDDIILAVPINKNVKTRSQHAGQDELINKILIIRNNIAGPSSFRDLTLEVRQTLVEADENRNYPVEILLKQLNLTQLPFAVALLLENIHDREYLKGYELPVILTFSRQDRTLTGRVEYRPSVYRAATIKQVIEHFRHIAEQVITDPGILLDQVDVLLPGEKEQLLIDFNLPQESYPNDKTIHGLFRQQVNSTPGYTALVDVKGRALTYQELDQITDRLAQELLAKGTGHGNIVGLMVPRSNEMILGILGILKAGAAYLPINPKQPAARTRFMLADCRVKLMLTTRELSKAIEALSIPDLQIMFLEETVEKEVPKEVPKEVELSSRQVDSHSPSLSAASRQTSHLKAHNLPRHNSSFLIHNCLAYVIYTSGSTGNPKGVPISHSNFCPLVHWGYDHLALTGEDRVIQNLSYYFDWSAWEIFITLTSGATLYMINEDILLDPEVEVDYILANNITVLHITPTQYQYLMNVGKKLHTLKHLCIGAEKLTYDLLKRSIESVDEDCRLYNMYGPTEATIMAATLEVERHKIGEYRNISSVPIGKTLGNTQLFILDKQLYLCPLGVFGELYIAGDALAKGYINNPELTKERFIRIDLIHLPYTSYRTYKSYASPGRLCEAGAGLQSASLPATSHHITLYKTGDRCRWLPDGTVEFLGRVDFQVKVRGYRIEPGEIEKRIMDHPGVKEAVVLARPDKTSGENYLCAYVVMHHRTGSPTTVASIREHVAKELPDYMVPSYFVEMEKMPLNPNGKVDLKALPEPMFGSGGIASVPYVAPRNEVEERLVQVWSQLLGMEPGAIGIDNDFFETGGHSLKAAQLSSRIFSEFQVDIELAQVFEMTTIRELAAYIESSTKHDKETRVGQVVIAKAAPQERYPLSSAQKRIYLLQQLDEDSIAYHIPQVLRLEGTVEPGKIEQVFIALIGRHDSLRTSFHMDGETTYQVIHEPGEIDFKVKYITEENDPLQVAGAIQQFITPFDLTCAPLLRVILLTAAGKDRSHTLLVDIHHVIADGTSAGILTREFMALYSGETLSPPPLQYIDYSGWQRQRKADGVLEECEKYWLDRFSGDLPVLQLPMDYPRPKVQDFAGGTVDFTLAAAEAKRLKAFASQENSSLYMILAGCFHLLIAKLSGQEDIIVGTVTAGRELSAQVHGLLEQVVGIFVNTLALRSKPTQEKTIQVFLQEVKQCILEARANQEYQFEDLVELLDIKRDAGRNPLFDVMFVMQNIDIPQLEIPGLTITPYDYHNHLSKFDLTFVAKEEPGGLHFSIEYSTRLFNQETIERYVAYFKRIIAHVLSDAQATIDSIATITVPGDTAPIADQGAPGVANTAVLIPPETMDQVTGVWTRILNKDRETITSQDDFFQSGGHSLKAAVLVSEIHKTMGVKLKVTDIFQTPTLEEVARLVVQAHPTHFVDLEPVEDREYYDLSYNQKRLYFLHQMDPTSPAFNLPGSILLPSAPGAAVIEKIIQFLSLRHESLRTYFKLLPQGPVQVIAKNATVDIKTVDLSILAPAERQQERDKLFEQFSQEPFDLSRAPLLRILLVQLEKEQCELMFNMHHIVTDGWSIEILKKEFAILYEAHRSGKTNIDVEEELPPLAIGYRDFAVLHQRQVQAGGKNNKSYLYWKQQLSGGVPRLELPLDNPAGREDAAGAGYRFCLEQDISARLVQVAGQENTSPFVVLFGVYLIMLYRFAGHEEVACSIITAGREHAALHGIIGFFVNSLIFTIEIKADEPFGDFIQRVHTRVMEHFVHQGYPLEPIFEDLQQRYPDVPVSFNMLNISEQAGTQELSLLEAYHTSQVQDVKFDIEPYVTQYKNAVEMDWRYRKNAFDPATMEHMAKQYRSLLDFFTGNLESPINAYRDRKKKLSFGAR